MTTAWLSLFAMPRSTLTKHLQRKANQIETKSEDVFPGAKGRGG